MSINVNVHSNPFNIKRDKILMSDVELIKENERQKRRKLRLEQVRQQSKDIAENIRNRVRNETNKQLLKLEKLQGDELKRWKTKKILTLQRQYNECLHEIGSGHTQAALQPRSSDILKSQKCINSKIAQERGIKAVDVLNEQQQKQKCNENTLKERRHLIRNIEKIRSTYISDLDKNSKVNSTRKKPKYKRYFKTDVTTNKSKNFNDSDNEENVSPRHKFNFIESGMTQNVQKSSNDKFFSTSKKYCCNINQKSSMKNCDLRKKNLNKKVIENCFDHPKTVNKPYESKYIQTEIVHPNSTDIDSKIIEISEKVENKSENHELGEAVCRGCAQPQLKCIQNEVSDFEKSNKETFNFIPDTRLSELISKRDESKNYDHSNTLSTKTVSEVKISQNYTDNSKYKNAQEYSKGIIQKPLTSVKMSLPKVEFYDHDNRFSHQYTARSDLVQRDNLNENLFKSDKIEEIVPKTYNLVRGKIALHKEKVDRDYKTLLEDLAVIQKEERLLSSQNTNVHNAHFSNDRLKQKEQQRQKQMESIFKETIYNHQCTPIVTIESMEKNTSFPIKDRSIQNRELNVATWDLPQTLQGNNSKKQTLENLLQRINVQKKLLLEEVKMLPEQSNLEKILDDVDCKKMNVPKKQDAAHSLKIIHNSSTIESDLFATEVTSNDKVTIENTRPIRDMEDVNITHKVNIKKHHSKIGSYKNKAAPYESITEKSHNKELLLKKGKSESNKQTNNEIITTALVHHLDNLSDEKKIVSDENTQISQNNMIHNVLKQTENSKSDSSTFNSDSNIENFKNSKKQCIEIHIVLQKNDEHPNIVIDPEMLSDNVIKIKKNQMKHFKLAQEFNKKRKDIVKKETANIEIPEPVYSYLNIKRPVDTDPSFLCSESQKLENSEVYVENTESTSYMSPPEIATFKTSSDGKAISTNDMSEKHDEITEIKENKFEIHENVKKHINKLLKMSKNNVNNLCVSSVSGISTPDSNVIQTSKNITSSEQDFITVQPKNSFVTSTCISNDNSSEFIVSNTYSPSLLTKSELCEVDNTFKQLLTESPLQIPLNSNNLYSNNSSQNNCQNSKTLEQTEGQFLYRNSHQNMLLKYSDLTENCTKRINDLTSLINELRRTTKTLYPQNNIHFIDNGEKSALNIELSIPRKEKCNSDGHDNKQNLQQKQIEFKTKQLNMDINEMNLQIPKQVYKSIQNDDHKNNSVQTNIQNGRNIPNLFSELYDMNSATENITLLRDFPINCDLTKSPKFNFESKIYQENDNLTEIQTDISNNSVFAPNFTISDSLQQFTLDLKNKCYFSPDIKATSNVVRYHPKPPVSLVQNAVRHNIDINTIPTHDLSTIVEVDTPITSKVDSSKNLSRATEMSHTNNMSKKIVFSNSIQKEGTLKSIHNSIQIIGPENMECKSNVFGKEQVILDPKKTSSKSNKETDLLPQTSIELSSIDSPSSDDFEIALKKMGIDWGISTIRKTRAALQLSSSSSSLDVSLKKLGVKLLEDNNALSITGGSDINLKEILQKQLLKKLSHSSSTSFEDIKMTTTTDGQYNIQKCDKISQDILTNSSELKQKRDKSQGRTSTPVSSIKSFPTISVISNDIPALFSDIDISSVKTPNIENLSLIVPNCSLESDYTLNKCKSS